jgi:hypothetical protein
LTANGSTIFANPGIVISIVGADTTGGSSGYVEASTIPNVFVLYVGITNISKLRFGIIL